MLESAKDYMTHERETLQASIAERDATMSGLAAVTANPDDLAAMSPLSGGALQLASMRGV